MSDEKAREEARRWLTTARGDLETARLLAAGRRWAHACFHAQQAAEKALKALWYAHDLDPWGHSVLKLIDELRVAAAELYGVVKGLREAAARLDRFYLLTRYPNGLPDITPEEAFFEADAMSAIELAAGIVEQVAPCTT
jgi:HEPN domain-containing protein